MPHVSSCRRRIRRLVALSSTTSARRPGSSAGATSSASSVCEPAGRSTRSVKVEPRPSTLSTTSSPPIASASRRLMARPRPVPPYTRVVEASTWLNERNSRSSRSAGIPMPVSRTAKDSRLPTAETVTSTSPEAVNFTALLSRLTSTWRSRVTSPTSTGGTPSSSEQARSRPFTAACAATRSSEPSTQSRTENGCDSRSRCPLSIFEKSRMSLMITSSASPLVRTVSAKSRCSCVSSVSSSSPVMPMTAFIGVRISCDIVARNADFAAVAASASARAVTSSASRSAAASRARSSAPAIASRPEPMERSSAGPAGVVRASSSPRPIRSIVLTSPSAGATTSARSRRNCRTTTAATTAASRTSTARPALSSTSCCCSEALRRRSASASASSSASR